MTHAYGLDAITFSSTGGAPVVGNGSGETIALIEAYHDPTLVSDLHVFDHANGLPDPSLSVVNQGSTRINLDWDSEETLDVEWAHAIAPAAGILVVEAQSDTLSALMKAVNVARQTPGVAAVSMSWGFSELSGETAYDATFRTPPGHQGITFVAASGDNGTAAGPEYPSSSPNVLAVGGTTLVLDDAGNYVSELAWDGSGGGYSPYEPEPGYQKTIQNTGHRSTPDVAFDGDPGTGVEVYQTVPGTAFGTWITVGGTSLGSPAWAAIIAIADQGRALAGKGSLDGPTQTLPTLYSQPSDFNTVSLPPPYSPWGGGVNPIGYNPFGGDFARLKGHTLARSRTRHAQGVNIATGLGSPIGPRLIAGMVASNLKQPISSTAVHSSPGARTAFRSAQPADPRLQGSPLNDAGLER